MLGGLAVGQGLMAAFWLGVVLLLILGVSRAARLLPAVRQAGQPAGALALQASMVLDTRRRLYLVGVNGRQALILAGGPTDVMLSLPAEGSN